MSAVWLVVEPDDGTTVAVFDSESAANDLAGKLSTSSRRFRVEKADVYECVPDEWAKRWRWA